MRLNGYFNRCRSESQMLARMRATFGPPAGVVIGIGDWGQHEHRAFMEPHKGKGFRDVLRRGGYRVLLVDASRTSVQCSRCEAEAARCRTSSTDSFCANRVGRRDHSGAIHIARLARIALQGGERPHYLSRRAAAARPRQRKRKRHDDDDDGQQPLPCSAPSPG
jgi:hypothetical protein